MTGNERPMDDLRLDALLGEWLGEGAHDAPDWIAERAMLEIVTTPQEGTRLSAMWASMTQVPLAWAAVAVLAAAIGIGLLMGPGRIGEGPSPTPIPSLSPSLSPSPSASAGEAGSHRSETAVGTIEWTRIESEQRIFASGPYGEQILGWEPTEDFEIAGLYASTDGITWEPTEGPPWGFGGEYLSQGISSLVAVSPDGYGTSMGPDSSRQIIYRDWTDSPGATGIYQLQGEEWVLVIFPSTAPPPTPGLSIYSSRIQGAAALDELNWVAPVLHFVEIPWAEVLGGDLTDAWPMWDEDVQRLEIHEPGGDPFAAAAGAGVTSLTVGLVAGDPPVIEFRDAETGALVHQVPATLPGWSPEALVTALRGWGLLDYSFVVSRDGEISVVRPPWTMGEDWTDIRVVTAFGRYYTISLPLGEGYSSTDIHLWESEDGISWTLLDTPQLWTGTLEWAEIVGGNDQLLIIPHDFAGSSPMSVSADGRNWTEAVIDAPTAGLWSPTSTDFGWLGNGFDQTAISADGLTWEWIDLPELPAEPSVSYFNGIFLYGPEQVGDQWVTWVGHLAD